MAHTVHTFPASASRLGSRGSRDARGSPPRTAGMLTGVEEVSTPTHFERVWARVACGQL